MPTRFFLVFFEGVRGDLVSRGNCIVGTDGSFVNQAQVLSMIQRDLGFDTGNIVNVLNITMQEAQEWAFVNPKMPNDAVVN